VVLQLSRSGERPNVWLSPALAQERFGLSPDTRASGLRELASMGSLAKERRVVDEDVFDFKRLRNTYTLNADFLSARPRVDPAVEI
jgi:hypothetical protein